MRFMISACVFTLVMASHAVADIRSDVEALFARDMATIDLARLKIEVDQMIDGSIDVEAQLAEIDQMAVAIEGMLPRGADSWAKIEAIRRYIYEAGPWNGNNAFSYDHDDPYGLDVRNKLLSDYIADRRGNCITMPFLFIILGQRLGLEVTPAMAPLHVFVKFTDDQGVTHNLETTSGAGRARDSHYRGLMPITDKAVENGVFLTPLTREQTVAVIATVLVEDLISRKRYLDAMAVANIILKHYPNFAYLMVKKGTAAYYLLQAEFRDKYADANDIPQDQQAYFQYLQRVNQSSFAQADALGWKPMQQ